MSKINEALFSKSTNAILDNIFLRPEGVHLRALMNNTGLGSASAQRELGKLTEAGLLIKEEIGKVILYKPNISSPVYTELNSIIHKTAGVEQMVKEALLPHQSHIECAFIYGSVAKHEDTANSDIDLLVIANTIGSAELYPILLKTEEKLGRKISLTVYRLNEFRRKLEEKNHFLVSVMQGKKIELIGNVDEQQC